MKFFRKRFKRRSFRARRSFRKFPRPGTKRFFRRQRRLPKPEIKWLYYQVNNTTIDSNGRSQTDRLQPVSCTTGTTVNNRIGKSIKFRRVIFNISLQTIYYTQQATGEVNYTCPVRIVVWSPVTTATSALAYINGTTPFTNPLEIEDVFDWNIIRVHRDVSFNMGRTLVQNVAVGNPYPAPSAQPQFVLRKFSIPHPRNVEFPVNDLIDPDRYTMYVSVFKKAATFPINYDMTAKTTFIDA